MIMRRILLLLTLFFNFNICLASPNILVSITPLASIAAMILPDDVKIQVMNNHSGCPHSYNMRFSDLDKLNSADYLLYIDNKFDLSQKITDKFNGKKIATSSLSDVNFIDIGNQTNWHFWLSLPNVSNVLEQLSSIFIQQMPDSRDEIQQKKSQVLLKIEQLQKKKQQVIADLPQSLVVSHALGHFFEKTAKIIYKEQVKLSSLNQFVELDEILSNNQLLVIADTHQDTKFYEKYSQTILKLEVENWTKTSEEKYSEIFFNRYNAILDHLLYIVD